MNALRRFLRRIEKRVTREMRFFGALTAIGARMRWHVKQPESIEYYHTAMRLVRHSERLGKLGKRWGYVH